MLLTFLAWMITALCWWEWTSDFIQLVKRVCWVCYIFCTT